MSSTLYKHFPVNKVPDGPDIPRASGSLIRDCLRRMDVTLQDLTLLAPTGAFDHGMLAGLVDDDHPWALNLNGRSGAAQVVTNALNTDGVLRVNALAGTTSDILSVERAATIWFRVAGDGQSYFSSSTTAGIVNIAGVGGGINLSVGTSGSTTVINHLMGASQYNHRVVGTGDVTWRHTTIGNALQGTWDGSFLFQPPSGTTTTVPVVIRGRASQSGNSLLIEDSAGTDFFVVGPTGATVISPSAAVVGLDVTAGGTAVNTLELRVLAAATKNFIECFTSDPLTAFFVGPTGHTEILLRSDTQGLIIQGFSSQTVQPFIVRNSASTILFDIAAGGATQIRPTTASAVALTVRRTSGTTADIQRWDNSTGSSTLSKITASGQIVAGFANSPTLTGSLITAPSSLGIAALTSIFSNTVGWSGATPTNGLWRLEPTLSDASATTGVGSTTCFRTNVNVDDTAGTIIGHEVNIDINESGGGFGVPTAQCLAFNASSSGTADITGSLIGVSGITLQTSSGAVTTHIGLRGIVRATAGTSTDMVGIVGDCLLDNADVTNVVALDARGAGLSNTATIVEWYGVRVTDPVVAGGASIATSYGIYLNTIDSATNNWAIYSLGGQSYHAGKFGINDTTPDAMLDIVCAATTDIGQIIEAKASQTANLSEWRDSSSNVTNRVDDDGALNLGRVDRTGETVSIGSTNIVATIPTGTYLVTVYHICTTAGTAGNLATTIAWTDNNGAQTIKPAADISLGATGFSQGPSVLRVNSGTVSYSTSVTGVLGSPVYALYVRLEHF